MLKNVHNAFVYHSLPPPYSCVGGEKAPSHLPPGLGKSSKLLPP